MVKDKVTKKPAETTEAPAEKQKSKFDRAAWDKQYRADHPEKFAEYRKRYYAKHKKATPAAKGTKKKPAKEEAPAEEETTKEETTETGEPEEEVSKPAKPKSKK